MNGGLYYSFFKKIWDFCINSLSFCLFKGWIMSMHLFWYSTRKNFGIFNSFKINFFIFCQFGKLFLTMPALTRFISIEKMFLTLVKILCRYLPVFWPLRKDHLSPVSVVSGLWWSLVLVRVLVQKRIFCRIALESILMLWPLGILVSFRLKRFA